MTEPQVAWERIAPFAMRDIGVLFGDLGAAIALGSSSKILLYKGADLQIEDYSVTENGLIGAVQEAVSGDTIIVPAGTITLTAALTIGAGVTVSGMGAESTILTCTSSAIQNLITCAGRLSNLQISFISTYALALSTALVSSTGLLDDVYVKMDSSVNAGRAGYISGLSDGRQFHDCQFWTTDTNGGVGYGVQIIPNSTEGAASIDNIVGYIANNRASSTGYGINIELGSSNNDVSATDLIGVAVMNWTGNVAYGIVAKITGGGPLTLSGCTGHAEDATTMGGIYAEGAALVIQSCRGSTADKQGSSTVTGIWLVDSTIIGGKAEGDLYGIYSTGTSYALGVHADSTSTDIYVNSGTLTITGCLYSTTGGAGTLTIFAPGGSGAPNDAEYVTLATDGDLTNERVLTGTSNQIVLTDGGAGSTITLSAPQDIHTGASPTFVDLILSGGDIYPSSNGVAAVQINKADGTTEILGVDTTNKLVRHILATTRALILALPVTAGALAYATDTNQIYFSDGTEWRRFSLAPLTDKDADDMGWSVDNHKDGYYSDLVTDKLLANVQMGMNGDMATAGDFGFYTDSDEIQKLQVYLNGVAEDLVTGIRLREDADGQRELEQKPAGLVTWFEVMSGNSDTLDLNGDPLYKQYSANMGAFGSPSILNGGTF